MNIMNKLTLRCLKMNKRRTIVTIIGIALSVMMVSSVFTVAFSFLDLFKREEIAQNGGWHAQLFEVPVEKLPELEQAEHVKAMLLTQEIGFAPFAESTNPGKPYFYIQEYNDAAFSYLLEQPLEGRLPQREGEALLAQEAVDAGCTYKIGDTITLSTGYRSRTDPENPNQETRLGYEGPVYIDPQTNQMTETFHPEQQKTYQITGIMKTPVRRDNTRFEHLEDQPGFFVIGYCATNHFIEQGGAIDPQFVFSPVRSSILKEVETLAKQTGAADFAFHDTLLAYSGVVRQMDTSDQGVLAAAAAALLVLMAGFAAMIYNAFSISVAERTQYLGLLASIGATGRQKRLSVLFEGLVLGLVAIPAGIILGTAGIGLLLSLLNPTIKSLTGVSQDMRLVASPLVIFLMVLASALLIVLSLCIPARRAAGTTPIDSIRQTKDVKLTRKAVKTGWMTRRLFGFEGEIALKNLKRNRKHYRSTVAALAVSMVLILTVTFSVSLFGKLLTVQREELPCDMVVQAGNLENPAREELYRKVLAQGGVTRKTYRTLFSNWYGSFDEKEVNPKYLSQLDDSGDKPDLLDGRYHMRVTICVLDEDSFKTYLEEIGEDWEAYKDPGSYKGILRNTFQYQIKDPNSETTIIGSSREAVVLNIRAGDRMPLESHDYKNKTYSPLGSAEIGAVTDVAPFGGSGFDGYGRDNAILFVPQKTGDAMLAAFTTGDRWTNGPDLCIDTDHSAAVREIVREYRDEKGMLNVSLQDYVEMQEEESQTIAMFSIFSAVLISLITLVCVTNMFNTISTNLILRRREFAMLRSVGMTQKSFQRMLRYESLFYGLKTLLYGLPIGFALMAVIYWALDNSSLPFAIPWAALGGTILALFLIIGGTMLYTGRKLKKNNIIDTLKDDVI